MSFISFGLATLLQLSALYDENSWQDRVLAFRRLLGENSFAEVVQILWSLQSLVSIHCLSFPLNFNLHQQRETVTVSTVA